MLLRCELLGLAASHLGNAKPAFGAEGRTVA
jgi:hypothetical protein